MSLVLSLRALRLNDDLRAAHDARHVLGLGQDALVARVVDERLAVSGIGPPLRSLDARRRPHLAVYRIEFVARVGVASLVARAARRGLLLHLLPEKAEERNRRCHDDDGQLSSRPYEERRGFVCQRCVLAQTLNIYQVGRSIRIRLLSLLTCIIHQTGREKCRLDNSKDSRTVARRPC